MGLNVPFKSDFPCTSSSSTYPSGSSQLMGALSRADVGMLCRFAQPLSSENVRKYDSDEGGRLC
jgi:hypothetical protein